MWLSPHFIGKPAKAVLSHRFRTDYKKNYQKEQHLTTYFQLTNNVIETNVTEDLIKESEAEIVNIEQSAGMTAVRYSEVFRENAFRCGQIYGTSRTKDIFTEG